MSAEAPARRGRGGKFAQRNAKRKARRDGTDTELTADGWKKPKTSSDPSKDTRFTQGKWTLNADGGFMVAPPDCPKFVEYYRAQNILSEEEWPAFLDALRTKLPTTFRLSTINGMHYNLLNQLSNEFQCTKDQNATGGADSYTYTDVSTRESFTIDPPAQLPWYPDGLGWYIRAGKSELKTKGNKFESFRQFLMTQNEQGNLNRQEAVSMIPPLLLDVQPHHIVLDMCAAPGSKTAQLLEGLHGGVHYSDSFKTPSGMVIANDANSKRAYLLVHQLKRYGSSAFLVTTHDGQQFPNLYQKDDTVEPTPAPAAAAAATESTDAAAPIVRLDPVAATANPLSTLYGSKLVQFDRILCDVPCSGDGTLRKNMNLWSMWDTRFANGLHFLQVMISCRALEMLKVGGLMVYSTCSFNPIENESVVMELCRRAKGALEIVDVSEMLPGLIRRPGLTTWKVRDTHADRWAEADEETIKNGTHQHIKASMFPPTQEEVDRFQPQRCMRVLPQSQDTGGFFIALLRKTGETPNLKQLGVSVKPAARASAIAASGDAPVATDAAPVEESPDAAAAESAAADAVLAELPDLDGEGGLPAGLDDPVGSNSHKASQRNNNRANKDKRFNEDPFEPMHPDTVSKILDFYGLAHDGVDHSNFFTRSDVNRKCYFVAPAIARILSCQRNAQKLKIVHTGSRCYERGTKAEDATYPCQFRVVQEGVESILPFMTKQILTPTFADAMTLLWKHAWPYKEMSREGADSAFYRSVLTNKNGCLVMVIKGTDISQHVPTYTTRAAADGKETESVVPARRSVPLCVWKTPHSISLMISPAEQKSLLHLLDPNEKFIPADVKAKRDAQKEAEAAKEAERVKKQQAFIAKQAEIDAAAAATAAATAAAAPATATEASAEPAKMEQ